MKVIVGAFDKQVKQITKKVPCDNTLDSNTSSPESADEVTPELDRDVAFENGTFIVSAEAPMSTLDVDDDLQYHSATGSEQQLPNEQPLLNETDK